MRNAECGMRSGEWRNSECGIRNVECGVGNGEWRNGGMGDVGCGMWNGGNLEYGVGNGGMEEWKILVPEYRDGSPVGTIDGSPPVYWREHTGPSL